MRQNNRRRNNYSRKQKPLSGCVTVRAEDCQGNAEKMVRRFIKKVKQEGIMDEVRERRHFKKPSDTKRHEREQRKRLIEKVNKQREELFKPKDRGFSKRKKR